MRKVHLTMKENNKYVIIKKLVETDGNKKSAAVKLRCSDRTINRLIVKYKTGGKDSFVHGNRNRKPATTIDQTIKEKVIHLYREKFLDTNLRHFCEILEKHYSIKVSDTTVNAWLKAEFILSPKAHRSTKKRTKKALKELKKTATSKKEETMIAIALDTILSTDPHPRRPRFAYFGEQAQLDASSKVWFADILTHLHLAIDDATGRVLAAYFDYQETLNGYYHLFYQILINYGIPHSFYTDKRTVFEYKKINAPSDQDDTFTQFSYACHQLGVAVVTTSIPQAKGRIERLNQTFQSRLPVELRLAGISTIEEANQFLKSYVKEYNQQFALPIDSTKNVFEKQLTEQKIIQTLSVLSIRTIDQGHCIKYKNKFFIPHTDKMIPMHFKKGIEALVIESFNGELYVTVLEHIYLLVEVKERFDKSKEFDLIDEEKITKVKKNYIPPMSHPWKSSSYNNYLNKQKHRQNVGANV